VGPLTDFDETSYIPCRCNKTCIMSAQMMYSELKHIGCFL